MREVWKPCAGYETRYSISDHGRLARTSTYGGRACWKLRVTALKKGYRVFHMCQDGVAKYRYAHLIVWITFKGPIPNGLEVNHKNGDRDDPTLKNLELLTKSENAAHSFRELNRQSNLVIKIGSTNGAAKLRETDIPEIFRLYAEGLFQWQIAERFKVSQTLISMILRRDKWSHVSGSILTR